MNIVQNCTCQYSRLLRRKYDQFFKTLSDHEKKHILDENLQLFFEDLGTDSDSIIDLLQNELTNPLHEYGFEHLLWHLKSAVDALKEKYAEIDSGLGTWSDDDEDDEDDEDFEDDESENQADEYTEQEQ